MIPGIVPFGGVSASVKMYITICYSASHMLLEFHPEGSYMLTKRQNLLETIRGGRPDRFVNQFEAFHLLSDPYTRHNADPVYGELNKVNDWGITFSWPEGTPGVFPVHTPDRIVVKDIRYWKDYVKAPKVKFSDRDWEPFIKEAEAVDRRDQYVTALVAPGLFEQCHNLCEIQQTLTNLLLEREHMLDLIKYLTEFELALADELCSHLRPDAVFHHDDWGSQKSTFMSGAMFDDFFLGPYKEIYGFYKTHGVELVVHHSDSYAATLVPQMIGMGIDIWQGPMSSNNLPELISKYGGRISFMGGIDSARVDFPGWTRNIIAEEVKRACDANGRLFYIPNTTQGMPESTYNGVYEALTEEIDKYSAVVFQ